MNVTGAAPLSSGQCPFISILIPCRNEEQYIAGCLESIAACDYEKDRMEVLVIDGMSSDRTRAIVAEMALRHPCIRIVDNPRCKMPAAMNIGFQAARGEIVLIASAHSTYLPSYFSKCVEFLEAYGVDNVGGALQIKPGKETIVSQAIARVLSHRFGSGNAMVKVGPKEPRWADTVAFGCYRKSILQRIGPWNEELAGSSDFDFNLRLKKAGGRILLVPELQITYISDSDLRSFWWHNFSDGVWATYVLKFGSQAWAWRHWVPLGFVCALLGSAALAFAFPKFLFLFLALVATYALTNFGVSLHTAVRDHRIGSVFPLMAGFAVRHFAHGLGATWGLILLLLPGRHWTTRRVARSG